MAKQSKDCDARLAANMFWANEDDWESTIGFKAAKMIVKLNVYRPSALVWETSAEMLTILSLIIFDRV